MFVYGSASFREDLPSHISVVFSVSSFDRHNHDPLRGGELQRQTRFPAMLMASAQTSALVFAAHRTGGRNGASEGLVAFEGIAVTGRVLRRTGLVLLLIIAILPG